MERIRNLVRAEAQGATPLTSARMLSRREISTRDQLLFRLQQRQPSAHSGAAQQLSSFQDLAELRVELQSCLSALEKFGEVNPRPPGFLNDRIQSGKRFLRRTLIWYMRPLRIFHGTVVHTLQQMLAALEKQQEMLGDSALHTELLAAKGRLDELELGTCQIYELTQAEIETNRAQTQVVRDELQTLREGLQALRAEIPSNGQQLKEVAARNRSLEPSGPERSTEEMDLVHATATRPEQNRF